MKQKTNCKADRTAKKGNNFIALYPLLDKQGGILVARKKITDRIEQLQAIFNLHDVWRVKKTLKRKALLGHKSLLLFSVD